MLICSLRALTFDAAQSEVGLNYDKPNVFRPAFALFIHMLLSHQKIASPEMEFVATNLERDVLCHETLNDHGKTKAYHPGKRKFDRIRCKMDWRH